MHPLLKDCIYLHIMKRVAIGLRGGVSRVINTSGLIQNKNITEYCDFISCYNCLKTHIIDANPNCIFDIFIHCWNVDLEKELCYLYNPVSYMFESNEKYIDDIKQRCTESDQFAGISSALSMKKVIKLIDKYSKNNSIHYDHILFYRPGVLLWKDMDFNSYDKSNDIYTNKFLQGNGDFYFIMSHSNILRFKYCYDSALFGNPQVTHFWIKNFVTTWMNCNMIEDTIEAGKHIECIRKINETSMKDGHLTQEMLNVYDPSSSLTFFILHHADNLVHIFTLNRCLESIRRFYKTNKIIVCKTSTTTIPTEIQIHHSIEVIDTEVDGSTVWGGIVKLAERDDIDQYIFVHDSMTLLKKLPNSIFFKKLYYLWHFTDYKENHHHQIAQYLQHSRFSIQDQLEIYKLYDTYTGWVPCFGPAFGGCKKDLLEIVKLLNLKENCKLYSQKQNIQCSERFLAILFRFMKIYTEFSHGPSLSGHINDQPLAWDKNIPPLSLEVIYNIPYSGYFFKTWLHRHMTT